MTRQPVRRMEEEKEEEQEEEADGGGGGGYRMENGNYRASAVGV